ncbi:MULTISPECIES: hypothetical protein [Methylobacterium]|uniref:hypothetical protein n=1 Tax=Methylobacterium TaxID=407 RepID=UPI001049C63D|nr:MULTISPECIES: hypothetical protein [Methylobacterium]MDR7037595.1 hypothetical protein [Methylobacterium sp. BE186]
MATMIIRDDVLWARHIEGDPELARTIRTLPADDAIVLRIEGRPVRFRKMRDGRDGRPTEGVRPEPADAAFWRTLVARRGAMVTVEPEAGSVDPYLLSLSATLSEWNSPEDAAAYDEL